MKRAKKKWGKAAIGKKREQLRRSLFTAWVTSDAPGRTAAELIPGLTKFEVLRMPNMLFGTWYDSLCRGLVSRGGKAEYFTFAIHGYEGFANACRDVAEGLKHG